MEYAIIIVAAATPISLWVAAIKPLLDKRAEKGTIIDPE